MMHKLLWPDILMRSWSANWSSRNAENFMPSYITSEWYHQKKIRALIMIVTLYSRISQNLLKKICRCSFTALIISIRNPGVLWAYQQIWWFSGIYFQYHRLCYHSCRCSPVSNSLLGFCFSQMCIPISWSHLTGGLFQEWLYSLQLWSTVAMFLHIASVLHLYINVTWAQTSSAINLVLPCAR